MTPNELAAALDEVVPPLYREEVNTAVRAHVASEILKHDASIRADEIKRRTRTETLARDIADHGLSADLNPTMPSSDSAALYVRWSEYLRRLDASLRERARAALDGPEVTP